MQLTARNIAVVAAFVASSAPSVFSLPLAASNSIEARDYELDLEAREIADFEAREFEDLELTARDLINEYYQSREVYDELDARSFDDLNYLDARDATPAATPSPAPASSSPAATSSSAPAAAPPSAASSAPPADGALGASTTPGTTPHHWAHMPSVLIRALTDEHHPKLKHYAEIQLHIFNTLVELSDGEVNDNGIKESAEVETLAKELLQLKRWHRHHLAHGHHHHGHKHGAHHHDHEHEHGAHHDHEHTGHGEEPKKDGEKPAHEKHDGAKDAATSASGAATPATSGAPHHGHHGHHGHHKDLYHAKIHELKIGSHKADRYIARARLHKDRLHLIALGPNGDNDEAYEAAVKHEKQWLERHQKMAAHLHKQGHAADPSATGAGAAAAPSATSTSTTPSASPSAPGAAEKPVEKVAEPAAAKSGQAVKRRALRRRGFF